MSTNVRFQALDSGTGEVTMHDAIIDGEINGEAMMMEYVRHLSSDSGIDGEMLPVHHLLYYKGLPEDGKHVAVVTCDDPHFGNMFITIIGYVNC